MRALLLSLFCLTLCPLAIAYGLLTHQAIIDVSWEPAILPALQHRFTSATADDLRACRLYSYGGAIMSDMGYFPRGSRLFSDLVHYVRTGDFVTALCDSASTAQEYAFALGALAHYTADRYGHPLGVNRAVPLIFPELHTEHGPEVSYADDPKAHARAEFGFDVLQTARGNYAAENYGQFISFRLADSLLKRTFRAVYGLELDNVFGNYERSVRSFRWAAKEVFPQLTRQAWKSRRSEIRTLQPTATARAFRYRMRRADFTTAYGTEIDRPGFRARLASGLVRFLPKVGPLKVLKPAIPDAEAEAIFIRSFDTVTNRYRHAVAQQITATSLLNVNYDTGEPTRQGAYKLADDTYSIWLLELHRQKWPGISTALKAHLLAFYTTPGSISIDTGGKRIEIEQALAGLRQTTIN